MYDSSLDAEYKSFYPEQDCKNKEAGLLCLSTCPHLTEGN